MDDSRSAHLRKNSTLSPLFAAASRPLLGFQSFCLTFRTLEGAEPTPGGALLVGRSALVTSQRAIPFPPSREVPVLAPTAANCQLATSVRQLRVYLGFYIPACLDLAPSFFGSYEAGSVFIGGGGGGVAFGLPPPLALIHRVPQAAVWPGSSQPELRGQQ